MNRFLLNSGLRSTESRISSVSNALIGKLAQTRLMPFQARLPALSRKSRLQLRNGCFCGSFTSADKLLQASWPIAWD